MRTSLLCWLAAWTLAFQYGACNAAGQTVVNATSQEDMMVGFGDANVSTIVVLVDITMNADWVVAGVPSGSKLYVLTRNLTIRGLFAPSGSSWMPTIDTSNILTSRVFIPRGLTLTFEHVMFARLGPYSSLSVGINGFAIVIIDSYSTGILQHNNTVVLFPYCSPLPRALRTWQMLSRPDRIPGNQTAKILPGGWCAVPYPGTHFTGQCFPNAYQLVDIAYAVEAFTAFLNNTHATPWQLQEHVTNVVILCNQLTTTNSPPASLPAVQSASPLPSGVIAGVALGAAAALALLAAGIVYLRRRRTAMLNTMVSSKHSNELLFDDPRQVSEKQCTVRICDGSTESLVTPGYLIGRDPAISSVKDGAGAFDPHSADSGGLPGSASTHDLVDELHDMSRTMQTNISDQQLHIQAVIGSGAYGTVYRGSWQGLQVAIKTVMFSSHMVGPGRGHGVLTEAALSKSISHPHVVATYSCDLQRVPVAGSSALALNINDQDEVVNDWRLYIIQEYCDGGSLKEALQAASTAEASAVRRGHSSSGTRIMFDSKTAFELAFDIACGMSHLHERNVVHGDLNPANVLLKRRDSGSWSPKVCDFGLSIHLPDNRSHMSNLRRGTPFYVAPEVLECGKMSRAADVFSMGVMLWELYMGRTVWQVSNDDECELCSAFPRLPPSAPPSYLVLLEECLCLDARQRPTFVEITDRLLQLCTGVTNSEGQGVRRPSRGAAAGAALPNAPTPDVATSAVGCNGEFTTVVHEIPTPASARGE